MRARSRGSVTSPNGSSSLLRALPSPAPKMSRPELSRSSAAVSLATLCTRRRGSGVTSAPMRTRGVAQAAAARVTHGSATARPGPRWAMWSQAKKPSYPRSSARAARRATTRGSASSPNSPISIARFTTAILTVHRELWLTVPRTDGRVIRWTAPPARGPRPPPWCTGGRRAAPGRPGPPPAPPPRRAAPPRQSASAACSASHAGRGGSPWLAVLSQPGSGSHSRAAPASSTVPSDLALQRIAERLYPDQAVAEYERVDTVIDEGRGSVSGPLQEEHVVFIDLGFQVPGRVWHVGEQLREPGPDAVLAALDPGGGDKDGIVGVVSDELSQVARGERLDVVLEDFLRRAWHFISFAASTLCLP